MWAWCARRARVRAAHAVVSSSYRLVLIVSRRTLRCRVGTAFSVRSIVIKAVIRCVRLSDLCYGMLDDRRNCVRIYYCTLLDDWLCCLTVFHVGTFRCVVDHCTLLYIAAACFVQYMENWIALVLSYVFRI